MICTILMCLFWNSIAQKFPYLVRKKLKEGEEVRRVAQLDWRVIESDLQKPFVTSGLGFVPLPVINGLHFSVISVLYCSFHLP